MLERFMYALEYLFYIIYLSFKTILLTNYLFTLHIALFAYRNYSFNVLNIILLKRELYVAVILKFL